MAIGKRIINYTLGKLFFPKVVTIDRPGIIYTKQDRKFGSSGAKRRLIFYFEDIFVNLQLETVKELGMKRTQEIYYQLGKKQTARYMLLAKAKKPPYFLVPSIINYILDGYRSGGASVAERRDYNHKEKTLILEGKDNIFCRKSKISNYPAGCISMTLSFLTGKNIEAKSDCGKCPEQCRIIADPKLKRKFVPDYKQLMPSKRYNQLNFQKVLNIPSNLHSFSDFMKFKKIQIDNSGKFRFKNKTIIPSDIGWVNMAGEHYAEFNIKDVYKDSIVNGAEKTARDILKDKLSIKEKINAIISMLAAFGWGLPSYKKEKNRIIFRLTYAPFSKYEPLYQAYVINGYLNYIFNNKFELQDIKTKIKPFTISLIYK